MKTRKHATLTAGIPNANATLYWMIRFGVGDPAALVQWTPEDGKDERLLIIRDIEMGRARKHARADRVACPADFTPEGGLSGDMEVATAQAVAECLRRAGIEIVTADRTLSMVYVDCLRKAGIEVGCDLDLGVSGRRSKDEQEIAWLREAQRLTEDAVRVGCELIAGAAVRDDGVLLHEGEVLTAERVRFAINLRVLELGGVPAHWIVAPGKQGGDCHEHGSGEIRTGEPVIIDVYPSFGPRYFGDCTRTVVHGEVSPLLQKMHAAVLDARRSAEKTLRAGIPAGDVHTATVEAVRRHGFEYGIPGEDAPDSYISLQHGTGHGVGLSVHEAPQLNFGGPDLVAGDAVTIEPGLYGKAAGGLRVEDLYIVTETGFVNLGNLPEGLSWEP